MQKPSFVYVTYIQTTPENVWDALINPELVKQYWGLHKNVSDWRAGSQWEYRDYENERVDVAGKVVESDRPRRLVLTWGHPAGSECVAGSNAGEPSRVIFEIEPFMDSVRLTVTHEELGPEEIRSISQGWPAILSSMKSLLETGKPLAMTTRRWTK